MALFRAFISFKNLLGRSLYRRQICFQPAFFFLADEIDKLLFTVDYLFVIRRDLYHVD